MFDVFYTVILDGNEMCKDKHNKRTTQGGIDICRRGEQAGHDTNQVAYKYVKKNRAGKREKPASLFADVFHHKIFDTTDDDFKEILHLGRHQGKALRGNGAADDQQQHYKPRVDDMGALMGEMAKSNHFEKLH
jgi:uncharacterized protein YozE (UPF0346 family)